MFRLVIVLTLLCSSCTAGLATVRLVAANKALRDAKEAGADVQAPYQYTLADNYLRKAVEQSSRSQYKASVELAKKAESAAADAIDSMNGTRRINLNDAGDDIHEDDSKEEGEGTGRKKDELDDEDFETEEEEAP